MGAMAARGQVSRRARAGGFVRHKYAMTAAGPGHVGRRGNAPLRDGETKVLSASLLRMLELNPSNQIPRQRPCTLDFTSKMKVAEDAGVFCTPHSPCGDSGLTTETQKCGADRTKISICVNMLL